jgi:tRNA pseudouridine55 synthase
MDLPERLLIDKPSGITSFDVIRVLRKKTGVRKFGHAGTLDPLATGLMILGVNNGTKKLSDYLKLDKEYVAEIRIGEKRTTDDLEGEIVEECEVTEIFSDEKISVTAAQLIGTHTLPVSAYSAIKQDGVPLYKKARKAAETGQQVVDTPMREMVVYEAELLTHMPLVIDGKKRHIVTMRLYVASGVYIRSLAQEFGRLMGYPTTIQSLRRTKIGNFSVRDAQKLEDF